MSRATKAIAIILTAGFLMGSSCWTNVPDPVDPEPTPVPTEGCAGACYHMKKLGCPEGNDLEDGTTCTKFCEDTEKAGHPLNTECIIKAESCEAMKADCGM